MSAIDDAVEAFDPISLDEANAAAELQTRFDRKYLVGAPHLVGLLTALGATTRVLDISGERATTYRSTYFDTAEYALFKAAAQGRRQRFKVRSRTYGDFGPCFLEVKIKGLRGANMKSRISYHRSDSEVLTTVGRHFVEAVTGRSEVVSALRPVLSTAYVRITLIDPATHTRLTFDRGVQCVDAHGHIASLGSIVIETKTVGAPSAADTWLWCRGIRPTSISKFGTGLAAIRPDLPHNKWHRVIARHWDVQSRSISLP